MELLAPGLPAEEQCARRLAENGFRIVVPVMISRGCEFSGNPQVRFTNQPHREWIYRQAFEYYRMGYGSALAWIFAAGLLVFTYFQLRSSFRWVYYAGE